MRAQQLVGLMLVALGALLFAAFQTGVGGEAIPLLVGAGFLVAYGLTRGYGLLIPGAVLTGLGAGIVVAAAGGPGPSPVLGLGLGFLAIYAADRLARGPGVSWWPLVPGGILTAVGVTALPAVRGLFQYVLPLGLVVLGLLLVVAGRRRTQPSGTAPDRGER